VRRASVEEQASGLTVHLGRELEVADGVDRQWHGHVPVRREERREVYVI
jgi:hypothetical protein